MRNEMPRFITEESFPRTRGNSGLPQHTMVAGKDYRIAVFLHHFDPPFEGFSSGCASGTATALSPGDRASAVVPVAHNEEENIASTEGVSFPDPLDGKWSAGRVYSGELALLPQRVNPPTEPPLTGFVWATCVVIAGEILDVLAVVLSERSKLSQKCSPLLVLGWGLTACDISEV